MRRLRVQGNLRRVARPSLRVDWRSTFARALLHLSAEELGSRVGAKGRSIPGREVGTARRALEIGEEGKPKPAASHGRGLWFLILCDFQHRANFACIEWRGDSNEMPNYKALREHLVKLLTSSEAHADFEAAVKNLPEELRGKRPKGA